MNEETDEQALFLTDSVLSKEQKTLVDKDSLGDPFYSKRGKWNLNTEGVDIKYDHEFLPTIPAQNVIEPEELYHASFTPKGAYITRVSVKFAFFQGWKLVKTKESHEAVDEPIAEKITKLNKDFSIKNIVIQMCRSGAVFGRSLVFLQEKPPHIKSKQRLFLRVAPILEQDIEYDDKTGWVTMFHPQVGWGFGHGKRLDIPPDKAVLFIWDQDECGNLFQGIPALLSSYQTILRSEIVSEEYSSTIAERGLGFVDVLDKKAKTFEDLIKVRRAFKLGRDRIFVHGENYEAKSVNGLSSGFNFDEAMNRYTKDISSGTGYPQMAIEGVQVGAVTGSETDQDNRAQMYRMIQEMAEPYIMQLYYLLDKSLVDADFELEWEFEVKQDRAKKAQVMATFGGAINQIQDLITVNQSLHELQLPLKKDKKEGDMLLSEYIALHSPVINTEPDDPNQTNNGARTKDYPKEDVSEPSEEEQKELLKTETDSEQIPNAKLKIEIAKRMLMKGDSYGVINTFLQLVLGSGLSNSTIQELRTKV